MEVTKKIKGKYVIFGIKGSLDMNNVKYIKRIFDDTVEKRITSVLLAFFKVFKTEEDFCRSTGGGDLG